jgi:hypothetical protein
MCTDSDALTMDLLDRVKHQPISRERRLLQVDRRVERRRPPSMVSTTRSPACRHRLC